MLPGGRPQGNTPGWAGPRLWARALSVSGNTSYGFSLMSLQLFLCQMYLVAVIKRLQADCQAYGLERESTTPDNPIPRPHVEGSEVPRQAGQGHLDSWIRTVI